MSLSENFKRKIKSFSPRQVILFSVYDSGQPIASRVFSAWGKDKKLLIKEIKRMYTDNLLEDSLDEKGSPTSKLRYPDGFQAMDDFILSLSDLEEDRWSVIDEAKRLIKQALRCGISKRTINKLYRGLL